MHTMSRKKSKIYARPNLRLERLKLGWTMSDFARRVGISRASISAIELRRWGVSEKVAIAICHVLHKDFDELFEIVLADEQASEKEKDVVHTG